MYCSGLVLRFTWVPEQPCPYVQVEFPKCARAIATVGLAIITRIDKLVLQKHIPGVK